MHLHQHGQTSTNRLVQFSPTTAPKLRQSNSVWNRSNNWTTNRTYGNINNRRSRSLGPKTSKTVHFEPKIVTHLKNSDLNSTPNVDQFLIAHKPSAIYRYNSVQFLNSLRNFRHHTITTGQIRQHRTELSHHYKMSKEILDSFVRLKSTQIDGLFGGEQRATTKLMNGFNRTESEKQQQMAPQNDSNEMINVTDDCSTSPTANTTQVPSTSITETMAEEKKTSPNHQSVPMFRKKTTPRPKSASIYVRRNRLTSGKSSAKLTKGMSGAISDDERLNVKGRYDDDGHSDSESLDPIFHRSLDKISSIANWERQIRYELEIEKELQRRELDRQKEKLQSDQRKLEEWDKQLRIELDARERKIRLNEEELRSRYEEFGQKSADLMRREHTINDIVTERIKAEMKLEIEKLRKKFNELELDKSNLTKKEERVKEVEARLHEQVKIVKEKIDSKRLSDIEMAKFKKEMEIMKKENEVLKEKVESMEDYQVTKFENRSMKNELQILKESLDSKNQELERERDRWEKEQRANDQKVISLRSELRKAEQELIIQKQKEQGDLEEMNSKYEAVNGQFKRLQAFVKDHLVKLNSDFSLTTQSLNAHYKPTAQFVTGTKHSPLHQMRHHSSSHHLHRLNRVAGHSHNRYNHQRSKTNGPIYVNGDELKHRNEIVPLDSPHNNGIDGDKPSDDAMVQKIVNKIYEKMSHQNNRTPIRGEEISPDKVANTIEDHRVVNESPLMSQLLSSTPARDSPTNQNINMNKSNSIRMSNSSGSVLHELMAITRHTSPPVDKSADVGKLNQGMKSMFILDEDDVHEELPNYQQSIKTIPQHRSLYEELLESDIASGSSSKMIGQDQMARTNQRFQSTNVITPRESTSIHNDDNNNHVLNGKSSNNETNVSPTKPTNNGERSTVVIRNNSGGESRSDSKSDSFEIDW
ncbi:hypothetical protein BLOT_015812 [Blomia tropicalis]|nr:hypothetical protein BLOT_015812 [Blomia tropicalis]